MVEFKKYRRTGLSEMAKVCDIDLETMKSVSISAPDIKLLKSEFDLGYVARNPKNHLDMWYVAKKYFDDNLELAE